MASTATRIAELERELGELRAEAVRGLPESFDVLLVAVGEVRLAVALTDVHEVVPRVMLFRMPGAPPWHAGSLAWRGEHVAVVDAGARWSGEPLPVRLEDRIVLMQHDGALRGLLVSAVEGVDRLRRDELTSSDAELAVGLATRDGSSVALVATHRLFGYER